MVERNNTQSNYDVVYDEDWYDADGEQRCTLPVGDAIGSTAVLVGSKGGLGKIGNIDAQETTECERPIPCFGAKGCGCFVHDDAPFGCECRVQ